jgi:hypothetical protein
MEPQQANGQVCIAEDRAAEAEGNVANQGEKINLSEGMA